jgi:hypothetical protein
MSLSYRPFCLSEKDTKLAQKLGQLQSFIAVCSQESIALRFREKETKLAQKLGQLQSFIAVFSQESITLSDKGTKLAQKLG